MAFVVSAPFSERVLTCRKLSCCPRNASISLSLSGPGWRQIDDGVAKGRRTNDWSSDEPSSPTNDFHGWSSDFIELCNAQLALLTTSVPNIAQAALFFRRENPSTGALEFVPLVVHSNETDGLTNRVWISAGAGQTALEDVKDSRVLPGSIPAEWIFPDYPFTPNSAEGGILMPDGGLCFPVEYNNILAGSVVLWPIDTSEADPVSVWSPDDIRRVDMVARTIALGAALEGKWHSTAGMLGDSRALINSMRTIIRTTLHQLRSPVQALITFGHLLRKKLPPGNSNRDLAKNIVVESLRLNDLLEPLDDVGHNFALPEASPNTLSWYKEPSDDVDASRLGMGEQDDPQSRMSKDTAAKPSDMDGLQLIWLTDVLLPLIETYRLLAGERGITMVADIEEDSPPIIAVQKFVREALNNLIDNALKYSPEGSLVGIRCVMDDSNENDAIEVIVWDTGYGFTLEDMETVWDYGKRGTAALRVETQGSGLGLPIVREMLKASEAEVSLQSPIPAKLDPRDISDDERLLYPGSAFTLSFKRPSR